MIFEIFVCPESSFWLFHMDGKNIGEDGDSFWIREKPLHVSRYHSSYLTLWFEEQSEVREANDFRSLFFDCYNACSNRDPKK